MPGVTLGGVSKSFATGWRTPPVVAIDDVSLRVQAGELLALVGPSGCGKSTLLRLVAGLETVDAGRIAIGERDVTGIAPEHRDVAMVFQSGALMSHLSVGQNLAFPLRARRVAPVERERRVGAIANLLGLDPLLARRVWAISGGERQRVALGRALVRDPACLLLDEPFAALDAPLRRELRAELRAIHRRAPRPTLHVTHDQDEALALGDRVAVMRRGRIEQVGSPQEVYERPATRFVATFIGPRGMNVLDGRMTVHGTTWRFDVRGGGGGASTITLPDAVARLIAADCEAGVVASVGVRPEAMTLLRDGDRPDDRLVVAGVVQDVQRVGDRADVVVAIHLDASASEIASSGVRLLVHIPATDAPPEGTPVRLATSRLSVFGADDRAVAHVHG